MLVEDDLGGPEGEGERERLEGWLREAEAALLPMRIMTQDQGEARGAAGARAPSWAAPSPSLSAIAV